MASDLDRVIDAVAWAKTCFVIAAASRPYPSQLKHELAKLAEAAAAARKLVDEYEPMKKEKLVDSYSKKHFAILCDLRVSELGLVRLSKL
jgi:hypothetical protein